MAGNYLLPDTNLRQYNQNRTITDKMIITAKQYRSTAKPKHVESKIQQDCVLWFNNTYPLYWLASFKNSSKMGGKMINVKGKQVPLEAIIAKREGLRKGTADLVLIYGNCTYNSLFIEMKADKGTQSKEQKEFQSYCDLNNFKYVICRSLAEFKEIITNYLNK